VNRASDRLQGTVPPMVQDAKSVAVDPTDATAVSRWRESNKALLNAVGDVRTAVQINPELPPLPDVNNLNLEPAPNSYFIDKGIGFGHDNYHYYYYHHNRNLCSHLSVSRAFDCLIDFVFCNRCT
jgi:hypothetical protein